MTIKELLEHKGMSVEDAMSFGYWSKHYYENLERGISNFDVFCEYPFWKLNKIYNEFYRKDNDIGSLYDWLDEIATDDVINQYLGKEND